MELNIIKNTKRNIVVTSFSKIVTLIAPFLTRTVVIKVLGIDYLGINSLFASILQVLNLSELGFSTAVVYSMYKPIAEDNTALICALLHFYRNVYKKIGIIILLLGSCILLFLPHLISGSYPSDINIYVVFLVFLLNTIMGYIFFAYKVSLLSAHQRQDVIEKCRLITLLILNVAQIILLIVTKNYYFYVILMPLCTLLNNILIYVQVKKMYPNYYCKGNLPYEIKQDLKKQVSGLFIYKLGGVSRNTFDAIFISAFLGLTLSGIYSNYYLILTSVGALMSIFTSSILAGIGNKIVIDSKEKNFKLMLKINSVYMIIAGWASICMICLYQTFMQLWVGDTLLLDTKAVILFVFYFYLLQAGNIRGVFADAIGIWWENRYRSIVEAIANIILNYVLLRLFGIYGILMATIITLFLCGFIWGTKILHKSYFKCSIKRFMLQHLKLFCISVCICIITFYACSLVNIENVLIVLLIKGVIAVFIPAACYFFVFRKKVPDFITILKKR